MHGFTADDVERPLDGAIREKVERPFAARGLELGCSLLDVQLDTAVVSDGRRDYLDPVAVLDALGWPSR